MSYSQTGYQSTKRQERTVTFVFPHTSGKVRKGKGASALFLYPRCTTTCTAPYSPFPFILQHCAGINSVVVSHDETLLWTASRDSLIKRWAAQ